MKLPRRACFINCVWGSIDMHTVGHRVELSPFWWITRRDSAPYPSVSPRFSGWFIQAHMWICRRWQPEGRQTPTYQREELKGCSTGGRLTIFTSIALRGRLFEGTSSLKTSGLDFHVRQNLFAPLSTDFTWLQFPPTWSSWAERILCRDGFACEGRSCVLKIVLKCLVAAGVPWGICPDELFRLSGVVPKSKSQVEKERALRPDAAGSDALLHCLRAASTDSARELCTGNGGKKSYSTHYVLLGAVIHDLKHLFNQCY